MKHKSIRCKHLGVRLGEEGLCLAPQIDVEQERPRCVEVPLSECQYEPVGKKHAKKEKD